ncbi:MAG: hypothetical protein LWX01_03055 [Deltaproteobacteria bacterium]|nr:hypothetical protein [Deltaproteobacteria bacterium]MDL1960670.1 hypothetical protein [Deltaproteobacteria bacterium]
MIESLIWIILAVATLTAILAIALLVRTSQVFQSAGKEMRDELRASREEARGAGKELREEVSVGLKSTNDTLSKTLEGMGKVQQTQLERMSKQLKEFTESNQNVLDRIRTTFDSRPLCQCR